MKAINLNVPIKDLDGNEIIGVANLGKILAQQLMSANSKEDVLKFYDWALKFHKGETVEVDRSDYEKLKSFVSNNEGLTVLAKGQILPLLEVEKVD